MIPEDMEVGFILKPTVHVLAVPVFYPHPRYKLPTFQPDPDEHPELVELQGQPCEQLIAHGGKGCYDSYGEDGRSIEKHIRGLVDVGHGSVLEHANISVFVEGISRGCSHEAVRHRAGWAYSQRSTRYVDEGECSVVLEPYMADLYERRQKDLESFDRTILLRPDEMILIDRYCNSLRNSVNEYRFAVDKLLGLAPTDLKPRDKRKWARGKARQLLPIALETRMTVTANLRAWRHFLVARSSRYAEPEIRRLANAIYDQIMGYAPSVFEDLEAHSTMVDGFLEYDPPLGKV
jgi:thymidylate synthase (FAD)